MRSVASISESPDVGFEPTTNGLTVHCSTAELIRNMMMKTSENLQKNAILSKLFAKVLSIFSRGKGVCC